MRHEKLLITTLCTALLVLASSAALAEECVRLKNGRSVVGTIERQDADVLWLSTADGTLRIPTNQIDKIEKVEKVEKTDQANEVEQVEKVGGTKADAGKPKAKSGEEMEPATSTQAGAEEQAPSREAVLHRVFTHLLSKDKVVRAEGIATVLTGWPATEFVVEAGLAHEDRRIRLAVLRILDMPAITDPRVHLLRAMRDKDVSVQVMSVRILRHRSAEGVEPHLVAAFDANRPWPVRQEILRTLEELGTNRCLQSVLASLRRCTDKRNAKAHRRVLEAVLQQDLGEDVEAWAKAVERVFEGEAEKAIRKGR